MSSILVLDNGSGSIKAGYAGEAQPLVKFQNFIGLVRKGNKKHYGDQLHTLPEYFLQRPHTNGLLLDAEMQRDIWERIFSKQCMNIEPSLCGIVVTEPFNCPASLRHTVAEVIFEDFGFAAMVACPAQQLSVYAFPELQFLTDYDTTRPHYSDRSTSRNSKNSKRTAAAQITTFGDHPYPALTSQDIAPRIPPGTGGMHTGKQTIDRTAASAIAVDPLSLQIPCQVVVDMGHQSCWAIPFYGELPLEFAALRMPVGGQQLNAYLRSLVTYRHTDVDRNELIVQNMKESCCKVSQNFAEDMIIAAAKQQGYSRRHRANATDHFTQYTLPDFTVKDKQLLHDFFGTIRHNSTTTLAASDDEPLPEGADNDFGVCTGTGTAKTKSAPTELSSPGGGGGWRTGDKQFVRLNNESIAVPEVLFNPADAGFVDTCGIAELIYRCIRSCPPQLQPYMSANILLSGGGCKFQGFGTRLHAELRLLLPRDWRIHIKMLENPENTVWLGGSRWAYGSGGANNNFEMYAISKEVYFDKGRHNLKR